MLLNGANPPRWWPFWHVGRADDGDWVESNMICCPGVAQPVLYWKAFKEGIGVRTGCISTIVAEVCRPG
jgi:hypothetical protein